jgi:hypothetical protein
VQGFTNQKDRTIMDLLQELLRYFTYLWGGITHALRLDPGVFAYVEQYPQSAWVVAGIVFLAGASTLLGQSAVLFINRVRKSRFVISLITNGLIFVISYVVWGLIVWLVGRILFSVDPPWGQFVRMVGLSTAPLVFGFLVLIPWMGPFVGKVLNVWSLLILIAIVEQQFKIGFWGAAICVLLGWLASLALTNTIGRPIAALRNKLFQRVTGSKLDSTADDLLLHFGGASVDQMPMPTSQGGTK